MKSLYKSSRRVMSCVRCCALNWPPWVSKDVIREVRPPIADPANAASAETYAGSMVRVLPSANWSYHALTAVRSAGTPFFERNGNPLRTVTRSRGLVPGDHKIWQACRGADLLVDSTRREGS